MREQLNYNQKRLIDYIELNLSQLDLTEQRPWLELIWRKMS